MRLTTVILIASLMQVSAAGLAQKISLSETNAPLKTVLREIKAQSGYNFIITEKLLHLAKPVTIEVKNTEIDEVLKSIFRDQDLSYQIGSRTVLIRKKSPSFIDDLIARFQAIDIRGRVIDEMGKGMAGVTVKVKNGLGATITGADGGFFLKNVNDSALISFSYVGYETKELKASGVDWLVQMALSSSKLDEVQVQAYGITSQRLGTGDIGTVKATAIEKQPVTSPLEALQGRIAGLEIVQQTGIPGSAFKVQIRGQASIANGTEPLYVIDGVPYTTELLQTQGFQVFGGNEVGTAGSMLNYLNLGNIESIDVLKDADATAIYGSRGANGVILITTKRGKVGTMQVDLNMYTGIQKVGRKVELMNTEQYRQMRYQAFANDGTKLTTANAYDLLVYDSTRYVDWQDRLIGNTANTSNLQLGISGGSVNTQYNVSTVYNRSTTVFPTSAHAENKGVNFNINSSSSDTKFNLLLSGGYMLNRSDLPNVDLTPSIFFAPNLPEPVNPDGSLNFTNISNNYVAALRKIFKRSVDNLTSNAVLSYRILPGLELKTNLGYNKAVLEDITATPSAAMNPAQMAFLRRVSAFSENKASSWVAEPQLNYIKAFGKNQVSVLLGANFQSNSVTAQFLEGSGYTSDNELFNPQAAPFLVVRNDQYTYRYTALFSRVTYNFDDQYILNLTGRRDGSSRFGSERRFSNFGSVGLGWIFTKAPFVAERLSWLSFGKLRGSYGITGNDQVGNYRYMSLYRSTGSTYQEAKGLVVDNLANPELAWERNNKFELGIDLGLLKDRVTFSTSYFRNRSSNQLLSYPLSSVTGFNTIDQNFDAVVQNSGLEFVVTSKNISSDRFTWSSSGNLTARRNKLVAFPGLATSSYANVLLIGQPISMGRYYQYAGVNPATGLYEFTTASGSQTSSPDYLTDRLFIFDLTPKFTGGITNTFRYDAFDLDFTLEFSKQDGRLVPNSVPGAVANQLSLYLDAWEKSGDLTRYQRYTRAFGTDAYNAYQYYSASSAVVVDASFIKLRNLSLGYTLPEMAMKKIGIKRTRIALQGQNLYTLTAYKGFDPQSQGLSNLPPLFTLTAGLQITF